MPQIPWNYYLIDHNKICIHKYLFRDIIAALVTDKKEAEN